MGKKSKNNKYDDSKKIRKIVNQELKKEIEKKFIDAKAINAAVGNDLVLVSVLSNPAIGLTDSSQRVGSKISLAGFHMSIIPTPAIGAVYRWVVFQWHEDSGSLPPTPSLLFQGPADGAMVIAPYNHDHSDKYTIICDKKFNVTNGQANDRAVKTCTLNLGKKYFKFTPRVEFTGVSNTGTNLLYMFIFTSNAVAAGDSVTYYGRTTYYDA